MKLSIVIPTYNEEEIIDECIKSLLKQDYKNFEIIVVDDGSTDKTKAIIKKYKKVKLIEGEHRGPGFSRNLGAKKAKGEVLIFVDADMIFKEDFLTILTKPIINGYCIGTENKVQLPLNHENKWSQCWNYEFRENKGLIFRAILKKEFFKMGGFDPTYGYADDLTFYFKYGIKSKVVEESILYHKNPSTLSEVYGQSRWIGASLRNKLFIKSPYKFFMPFILILTMPFFVPIISIKKSIKNKNLKILFPWMIIFMSVRYLGTVKGILRRVFQNKNVR